LLKEEGGTIPDSEQETIEIFAAAAHTGLRHPAERARAEALVRRWAGAWKGRPRSLTLTRSNHGFYLHFNQLIGTIWIQAFALHADPRTGLALRGPATDRARKSHKLRAVKLERTGLDALFDAWSAHPEARPAGLAVEFLLVETSDETWEACLREVFQHLGA
jgi:hypothetical protein